MLRYARPGHGAQPVGVGLHQPAAPDCAAHPGPMRPLVCWSDAHHCSNAAISTQSVPRWLPRRSASAPPSCPRAWGCCPAPAPAPGSWAEFARPQRQPLPATPTRSPASPPAQTARPAFEAPVPVHHDPLPSAARCIWSLSPCVGYLGQPAHSRYKGQQA